MQGFVQHFCLQYTLVNLLRLPIRCLGITYHFPNRVSEAQNNIYQEAQFKNSYSKIELFSTAHFITRSYVITSGKHRIVMAPVFVSTRRTQRLLRAATALCTPSRLWLVNSFQTSFKFPQ